MLETDLGFIACLIQRNRRWLQTAMAVVFVCDENEAE